MSSVDEDDLAVSARRGSVDINYANGSPGVVMQPDGSGFVYYPSSSRAKLHVACCVVRVNDYQFQYYFYDRPTKKHPKRLLCTFDQHAVGFAINGDQSSASQEATKLILSKEGGTMCNAHGNISKAWLWNQQRQSAGTLPSGGVSFALNSFMRFRFSDRKNIFVTFKCENIHQEFPIGLQTRREDSYLDYAVPGNARGQKTIRKQQPTLLQRQSQQNARYAAQRLAQKPSSERISNADIASVLESLEDSFKVYDQKLVHKQFAKPFNEKGWKDSALAQTLREVPKHSSGQATGSLEMTRRANLLSTAGSQTLHVTATLEAGFDGTADLGEAALGSTNRSIGTATVDGYGTMTGAAFQNGRWVDELAVKSVLTEKHPVLARSQQLRAASGRYSTDVNVKKHDTCLLKLPFISAPEFDHVLTKVAQPTQLVLVVCTREDDPRCRRCMQVLESAYGNLKLQYPSDAQFAIQTLVGGQTVQRDVPAHTSSGGDCPYRMFRFDMAQSRYLINKHNIHAVPFFLMYYNAKLTYAGTMGGASIIRLPKCNRPLTCLLIEPDAASQLRSEKVLRTMRMDFCTVAGQYDPQSNTNVGMASEAAAHMQRLAAHDKATPARAQAGVEASGVDATAQTADYFSIILVNAALPLEERQRLTALLMKQSVIGNVGGSNSAPKLTNGSLIVAMHDVGTVLPGPKKAEALQTQLTHSAHTLSDSTGTRRAWACPSSGIVQNSNVHSEDLLLQGLASVAVIKPLRHETITQLVKTWQALYTASKESVHLGITQEDVLRQMEAARDRGQRGIFLPADYRSAAADGTVAVRVKGVAIA